MSFYNVESSASNSAQSWFVAFNNVFFLKYPPSYEESWHQHLHLPPCSYQLAQSFPRHLQDPWREADWANLPRFADWSLSCTNEETREVWEEPP